MPVAALLRGWRLALALILLAIIGGASQAQQPELGNCTSRPTVILDRFYLDVRRWCPESIIHDTEIEPFSFTALDVAPDGTLYATRPLTGQVMVIRDSDGDELPDAMETYASGLTLPNGLAFHESWLYVAGGSNIYRIAAADEVEVLVDDLPSGSGFWTGGITIGEDERLYVAVGAPCDNCEFDEQERGAILSMRLDGSDRQVVAAGFRRPADLAFFRGELWTLDSAPGQAQANALDELNRVSAAGWYGFPYCLGADTANIPSDAGCAENIAPVMLFGSGAVPNSLAAYPYDTLPGTEDTLIVVLRGEPSQVDFVGYKVIMITFDENDLPLGSTILLPYHPDGGRQAYLPYDGAGTYWKKYIYLSEIGRGFYPQQPLAVAVNRRGWIYISLTGGRIIALRPAHSTAGAEEAYPIWTPMHPDFDPAAAPAALADE